MLTQVRGAVNDQSLALIRGPGIVRCVSDPTGPAAIAARLRDALRATGKSKRSVERELDGVLSKGYLSRLTSPKGYGEVSVQKLAAIARVLGVRLTWLAEGRGSMMAASDDAENLPPREAVRRRALYITSTPLVRAHFDSTPALEPSGKSRDELIAMYEEYIAQLRGQERAGFLGPVGAGLQPGDEIEEVDDPDDAG